MLIDNIVSNSLLMCKMRFELVRKRTICYSLLIPITNWKTSSTDADRSFNSAVEEEERKGTWSFLDNQITVPLTWFIEHPSRSKRGESNEHVHSAKKILSWWIYSVININERDYPKQMIMHSIGIETNSVSEGVLIFFYRFWIDFLGAHSVS